MVLTVGVLLGLRFGVLAILSTLWGAVLLHYRMRYMAAAAFVTGVTTVVLLFIVTGRIF